MVDDAFIEYFRQLAREPDKLKAILQAAESAFKEGCGKLQRDRAELSKQLSSAERESMALVDPPPVGLELLETATQWLAPAAKS